MGIKFLVIAHPAAMLCGNGLIASKQFKQCNKLVKLQNQVEPCQDARHVTGQGKIVNTVDQKKKGYLL